MQKFICLQSGHQNTQNNCDTALRTSTGAPGEAAFNIRIRDRLSQILIDKGFMVQLVDACFNCSTEATKDFDLFFAIHYDANVYGIGGGFCDYPDPSVDQVSAESKRIKEAIESEYFTRSGIVNHPERSNANTKFYYMWRALSAKTPCVILECGVGQDAHDSVILADTDRVATAIARGICKAFGVAFDPVVTPTPAPTTPTQPTVKDCSVEIANAIKPYIDVISQAKTILYGKGWPWKKVNQLKTIIK